MRKIVIALILLAFSTTSFAETETLSLQQALALGLQYNFDLQISRLNVERADAGIMGEEGRFDVLAELGLGVSRSELPVASGVIADDLVIADQASAEAALRKTFATGLETRLSLIGESNDSDALADQLDPAYRTYLILDLTQPLLKDMGIDINTTSLQIARTRQQQAALGYLSRAQQLAAEIELTYLDLVQADEEYRYAILARDLAQELLDGNQRKFNAGLIPVTEVNEARSAKAGREENMLLTKQKMTLARNQLLELIEQGEAQLPQSWQADLPEVRDEKSPDLVNALATGLKKRPDLQQARLEIESRKIALVYADNQRLPRLDLEASFGVNGLSGEGDNTKYDGDWHRSASRAL
ncbi:MAG: TolC family protein, partial [Desulfuromonadales bacterium]|nr:TolC family protein [Desulfuromonadales bacterium]